MVGGAGHFDCLAAMVYLNRSIPWGRNPNPPIWHDPRTHYIPNKPPSSDPTTNALTRIFGRRRR